MRKKDNSQNKGGNLIPISHQLEVRDVSDKDKIQNIEEQDEQTLPHFIEDELDLNVQKYSNQIKDQIRYLLLDLLRYPSTEQAQQHSWANRLGYSDLKNIKNKKKGESTFNLSSYKPDHCKDCGLLIQQRQIPLCSQIWQFPTAGLATFKQFQNIKLIALFIFVMAVVYSIQALYVNIVEPTQAIDITNFPKKLAYSAKMLYTSSNSILTILLVLDAWLLVLTVIIWWMMIYCVRCCRVKYQRIVDQQILTAADFTIMVQNLPLHYEQQKLQLELNRYFQSLVYKHHIKNSWGEELKPFTIVKMSRVMPFSLSESQVLDQELQGLDDDILQKKKLFASWVIEMKQNSKFSRGKAQRQREYQSFQKMRQRRKNKVHEMQLRAKQQYTKNNLSTKTTTAFVTFAYNQSAAVIDDINPQNIPAKIRYVLSCFRSAHYFKIRQERTNEQQGITASRAPEPEDIIWGNIGVPLCFVILRKMLVCSVLLFLNGVTFAIVYGFTVAQIQYPSYIYISFFLGLSITIMNLIIRFTARKLSFYQKDFTETSRQSSILIKGTICCMINSVIAPVITNLFIDSYNIFGSQGLVYDIFFLAITNMLLPPLLRILDPMILVRKVIVCWNMRPYKKIVLKQSQLNQYLEHQDYQLGHNYTYFIDLLYFTCFYAPMHPAITAIALIGLFAMYWAQKYCLLRRAKRPALIAATLTQTVNLMVALSPLLLALGGLSWVCWLANDNTSNQFIAYMVLLGIGVLQFIHPYHSIYNCLCHVPEQQLLSYQQCRMKLQSEYDRMNPATAEKGMTDYYHYMHDRKHQDDKMTALNRSQDNLLQALEVNRMIDQIIKIPNIFGKNNQLAKKMDREDLPKSVVKPKKAELEIFVSPSPDRRDNFTQESFVKEKEKNQFLQDRMSHPDTQKKVVLNYNSSGNTYSRKKRAENRKTVSVLQGSRDYQFMDDQLDK